MTQEQIDEIFNVDHYLYRRVQDYLRVWGHASLVPNIQGIWGVDYFWNRTTPQDETYRVHLNGVLQRDVLGASVQDGFVEVWERDWRTNELISDTDDPSGYRRIELKGEVTVEKIRSRPIEGLIDSD